ncbi:protease inhibitor I42 family protein [Cellulomonas cellasea]|uniref:Putative secreted protein n=1 Tax=Cellulomonas cellasea TaxID=43670 RepID=A0A7W4UEJ1_9CELL|nr:protease inhibitor I42 family protein [Cellulomonas cellasea]MBB2922724.1 putative secreted protein [Cellulomonas cellasea]
MRAARTPRPAAAPLACAAAASLALALALTACGPPSTSVPYTVDEVVVPAGQTIIIDLGEITPSVGDDWRLTTSPDAAVLTEGEVRAETEGDDGATGTPTTLGWAFDAVAPGTTTIGFTYSYRGEDGDPHGRVEEPEPTIVVTVTD